MAHPYEWYKQQSTDYLIALKLNAGEELFKQRYKLAQREINYWSKVFALINGILKERNNG